MQDCKETILILTHFTKLYKNVLKIYNFLHHKGLVIILNLYRTGEFKNKIYLTFQLPKSWHKPPKN